MEQPIPTCSRCYTVADYFEIEAGSEEKFEFREGELIAMAGGSESHGLISINISSELRNRLKDNPCRVYGSDMRLCADRRRRYTYPDVTVVCGERAFDPDDPRQTTLCNPTLVIEVLSASTELTDRTDKFWYYFASPSMKEYVMVSQDKPMVESYLRQDDGTWSFAFHTGLDAAAKFRSLGLEIPLKEIFAKVVFPPPPESPENTPAEG